MNQYLFQYCQKIVVFRNNGTEVLLAKRKGEKDYDGIFSFIGGKMQTDDGSIIDALAREKKEEVGRDFKIKISPTYTTNLLFRKKDGNFMILPHYYAEYVSGEIILNDEYSEYKWVKVSDLKNFEPKIPNLPDTVGKLLKIKSNMSSQDLKII